LYGSTPTTNFKLGSEGKLNMLMSTTSTGFTNAPVPVPAHKKRAQVISIPTPITSARVARFTVLPQKTLDCQHDSSEETTNILLNAGANKCIKCETNCS
jgi:hypothetical protein